MTRTRRPFPLNPAPWLRRYDRRDLAPDLMAGLTVAVMLVPQGMAYALLAGMPPVAGLLASTLPIVAYAAVGSSRALAVGPVAIVSLLTFEAVHRLAEPGSAEYLTLAATLALLVGVLQFGLGLLRSGVVVNFLSHAVVSGFTSAAAIVIGLSQLRHLVGVPLDGSHPLRTVVDAVTRVGEIHPTTLAIGLVGIALLLAGRRLHRRFPGPLLVVVLGTAVVAAFGLDAAGVRTVGEVPAGLPTFSWPAPTLPDVLALLPTALTIAFVGFMESIAVARALAAKEREQVDPDRELAGLGLANLVAGVIAAFPVTGGFSRSAVNAQAGARSGLASVVTALLVLVTLAFLTPAFRDLPQAVLAAIVLVAVSGLVDLAEPRHLWRLRPKDGATWLVTFVATLVIGIEPGILIGVATSLGLFVVRSAFPHVARLGWQRDEGLWRNLRRYPDAAVVAGVELLRFDAALYFANAAFLRTTVEELLAARPDTQRLVLDLGGAHDIDAVGVETLLALLVDLEQRGVATAVVGLKGPVRDVLDRAHWNAERRAQVAWPSIEHALDAWGIAHPAR
ncbi:MAG: sulfate permease [Trueperaceae bacterium]|nr:sulfate permease [Trueperaceae bacterium]